MLTIGILALQGAFAEHKKMLEALGNITYIEIRNQGDLSYDFDGFIFPGGESTVMGKLLKDLNLFHELKEKIENGTPVLATCSGLILLSEHLYEDSTVHFGTLPVLTQRNAYGRQLGSFMTTEPIKNIGEFPMVFIRAPLIKKADEQVEVLAKVNDEIVAVQYQNQIALSFHPELTADNSIHKYFIRLCNNKC